MWSPTGKPVAPLSFAELLRNRRDLVVRHPALNRIHPRLKPWLSADGVMVTDLGEAVTRVKAVGANQWM